jgi:hypothetical protein
MRRLLACWAALGIVLASAAQFRASSIPVGPGELLLVGWILFIAVQLLRGVRFSTGRIFWFVLGFWLISAALLAVGTLVALHTHQLNAQMATRDAMAFAFLAVLAPLLALNLSHDQSNAYHENIARYTFVIFTLCGACLLLIGMFSPSLGPIELWYGRGLALGRGRFQGWTENPNQLALFTLGMPFLGIFFYQRAKSAWRKAMCAFAIGCCLMVGLATFGDGLRLAWIVGLGGLAALAWWRAVLRMRGRFVYITHALVPFVIIFSILTLGDELVNRAWEVGEATYQEGGQGNTRITHWMHGIEVILQSPVVGFGPGPHSGIWGPFQDQEAHSTPIDWGTSTGMVGIALHFALVIWCAWKAFRVGSFTMFSMVMALTVFSIFSYTIRWPVYWLLLILSATLPQSRIEFPATAAKGLDLRETAAPRRIRAARSASMAK